MKRDSLVFHKLAAVGVAVFVGGAMIALVALGCGRKPAPPADDEPDVVIRRGPSKPSQPTPSPATSAVDPEKLGDDELAGMADQWATGWRNMALVADAIARYPTRRRGREPVLRPGVDLASIVGAIELPAMDWRRELAPFSPLDLRLSAFTRSNRFTLTLQSSGQSGQPPVDQMVVHVEDGQHRWEYPAVLQVAFARSMRSHASGRFDAIKWLEAWELLRETRRALEAFLLSRGPEGRVDFAAGQPLTAVWPVIGVARPADRLRFFAPSAFKLATFDPRSFHFTLTATADANANFGGPQSTETIQLAADRGWWPYDRTFASSSNPDFDPFTSTGTGTGTQPTQPTNPPTGSHGEKSAPLVAFEIRGTLKEDRPQGSHLGPRWPANSQFPHDELIAALAAEFQRHGVPSATSNDVAAANIVMIVEAEMTMKSLTQFMNEVGVAVIEMRAVVRITDNRAGGRNSSATFTFDTSSQQLGAIDPQRKIPETIRLITAQLAQRAATHFAPGLKPER